MQGADDTGGATAGRGHGPQPRLPEQPQEPQETRPVRPAGSAGSAEPLAPAGPAAPLRPAGAPLPPELSPLHDDDPRTVGPYRLAGRLGAGGMGAVYGGLDEHGRCLAVKTVHARHAADPGFRAGFAREIDLLRRAGGVCTAVVHAADPEAASPWMAFDFIPGRNLRTHIRQIGPLRGPMLRAFAAGTAEALAAFHAVGIVHRDIKPGNVILAPDGPKVVDFGIATAADEDPTDDPSASYGTPGWIAPERYRGAAPAAEVDVFAWGCLVAMAATGREPFGKGTPAELQERVLNAGPDLDGVPADLLPLVEGALAKTPRQRPAALEVFAELVGAGAEAEAGAGSRERARGAAVAGSVVRPDGQDSRDGEDGPPQGEPGRPAATAFGAAPPAERLRALLRENWRNVDAGWHSPELWAAAAGTGAAAVAAAGVGAVVGAGTAAGGAGTAGGTSGAAGGAGAAGAVAGAGTGGAGAAAGGAVAVKAAAAVAAVVVGGAAVAGGVAGYRTLAGPGPQESVEAAGERLVQGRGFAAEVVRSYTPQAVEEEAAAQGLSTDRVREQGRAEMEYRYSGGDRPVFLATGAAEGAAVTGVAAVGGEVYAYGPAGADPGSAPGGRYFGSGGSGGGDFPAESFGPELVADALASMAAAEGLAEQGTAQIGGEDATEYAGPMTVRVLVDGRVREQPGRGRVWIDGAGDPVRLVQTTDRWQVETEFTAVDGRVAVAEPETVVPSADAPDGAAGPRVVAAPVCGQVATPDGVGWDVRSNAWDISCSRTMEVARTFAAGDGEYVPGWSGTGVQTAFIDGEWACVQGIPHSVPVSERRVHLDHCVQADPVGTALEYELGDRHLITFRQSGT